MCVRKPTIWVPTRSNTNQPLQSQMIARSFKFRTKEEDGVYYPFSENKGADQLRGSASRLPRSWSAPLFSQMQYVGFLIQRLKYGYII